jgi:hypothetical protein
VWATCHTVNSMGASLSLPCPYWRNLAIVTSPSSRTSSISLTQCGVYVEEAPVPAPDTVVALEGVAALQAHAQRDHLHFGIVEREKGLEVAMIEGSMEAAQKLHVLVRHRQRSISRREQGVFARRRRRQ